MLAALAFYLFAAILIASAVMVIAANLAADAAYR